MKNKVWFRRVKAIAWIIILGVMFYAGATILFLNSEIGHSYIIRDNAERVTKHLTAKQAKINAKLKTSYDAAKTTSVTTTSLWKSRSYVAAPIGKMSIPIVNIHNPLFAGFGTHQQNLSYGVCTVVANRIMGGNNNYVLAGHYMGGYGPAVLDNLHYMKTGDKIYLTDLNKIYEYTTYYIQYDVKPSQIEFENNNGNSSIVTLITCSDFNVNRYGNGQHRTVVQGKLTGIYKATENALEQCELSDKVVQKTVNTRTDPKPKVYDVTKVVKKVVQNSSLKGITTIFTIIWTIVMLILIVRVFRIPSKKSVEY